MDLASLMNPTGAPGTDDKENIEPQQKRQHLSEKVIGFRDAVGVAPDTSLSEDDEEFWPLFRKSRAMGWL